MMLEPSLIDQMDRDMAQWNVDHVPAPEGYFWSGEWRRGMAGLQFRGAILMPKMSYPIPADGEE